MSESLINQTVALRDLGTKMSADYAKLRAERLNLSPEKLPEFIRLTAQHWWSGASHETALQMAAKEVMA